MHFVMKWEQLFFSFKYSMYCFNVICLLFIVHFFQLIQYEIFSTKAQFF